MDITPLKPVAFEDINALIKACGNSWRGKRDKAAILALLDTGARAREFLALDIDDVNLRTGAGAPFSRAQFVQLRGEILRRGLLMWNSHNDNARGVRVTGKGMALCHHFASIRQSPTPVLEMYRQCE